MQHSQLTQTTNQQTSNMLNDFHSTMIQLPATLRENICKECNWDIPTYNRKCRSKPKKKSVYNKEEELTIMTIYLQTLQTAFDQMEKHKKLLSAAC